MLVRKYLQQVFQSPGDYRRILAVTFTNKAADEMKGRILTELDILDKTPQKSSHLAYLSGVFNKPDHWVQATAGRVKSMMLHDYTRISIGTIDSFFQQVLRSFARESGLSSTFQLELDTGLVLEKFSQSVFSEASSNSRLMNWLVEWVTERMENSETWHKLEGDLVRLGQELLKEDILADFVTDSSSIPSPDEILELRNACRKIMKDFNNVKAEIAAEARDFINNGGYTIDDFSYGMGGPAGTLLKLAESDEGPKARALDSMDNPEKWVTKKSLPSVRDKIIKEVYPKLNGLMHKAAGLYDQESVNYYSARAINRNLYALGFASFLFDYFRNYYNTNNQLLLSLAQPIVNQIIGNNPSPFIYEKTGTWYHHFLIDEFQDTSDLQWKNFKPLIVDSLAADGMSMIVGDIKQSLYRWRNSNWRLLHHKATDELKSFGIVLEPLTTNQRSRKSIIDFNNLVFSGLPALISEKLDLPDVGTSLTEAGSSRIIHDVFKGSDQVGGAKANLEGRVEIRFLDKKDTEDWNKILSDDLPVIVADLLNNKGYKQSDIVFLVRKKADGDKITRILASHGSDWTFISSDVFRIGNSPVIKMIINAMRFLADPGQALYLDLFLWDIFLRSHPGEIPDPGFQTEGQEQFLMQTGPVADADLLTITDKLITAYQLDSETDDLAYVFQFRDQVKNCMNKGISQVQGFLAWWDTIGYKQMLASESLGSSMRVMTIHKAKGLSSPVVIIPYCNWEFNHSAGKGPWLWVSSDKEPFNKAKKIPVRYDSALEKTLFAASYSTEKIDSYLDSLNLLYVAFTRAIDVLIVFCPFGNGFRTVAEAMHEQLGGQCGDEKIFRMGNPGFINQTVDSTNSSGILQGAPMITGKLKTRISHRIDREFDRTRFGNNVHHILEKVRSKDDLVESISKSVKAGYFSSEEAIAVQARIEQLFAVPEISDWFSGNWQVLNEAGILVPGSGERRPDRVMIQTGTAVVIDYKTGATESRHSKQVESYMKLLSSMGYPEVRGYLLYIESGQVIEVKCSEGSAQPDQPDQTS